VPWTGHRDASTRDLESEGKIGEHTDRTGGRPSARAVGFALILLTAACGSESADEPGTEGDAGDAAPGGAATLTVEGRAYSFDRVLCAFGPDQTGREDTEFVLSARQDGLQLDATINTRFGHVVSVDDLENLENPRVAWSAGEPHSATENSEEIIRVDGKRVSVEATFTDQTTGATASGRLEPPAPEPHGALRTK
jgi:hypothetical protein